MSAAHPDEVERSIAYIETFEPGFSTRIRGATADQIDALESASGRPIHPLQRTFLERMGEHWDLVELTDKDPRVAPLLDFYAETGGRFAERLSLFAIGRFDPYEDVFLIDQDDGSTRIGVAYSCFGGTCATLEPASVHVVCGSLAEMLCIPTYTKHVVSPRKYRIDLSRADPTTSTWRKFERLVVDEKLERTWFSNDMQTAAEFGSTTILVRQPPGAAFVVAIASDDLDELDKARGWMADRVGVV